MKIAVILGTRPEIIKMQPIIGEIQKRMHDLVFINTGQHFDFDMSDIFVNELQLPKPNHFLKVRARSQGVQTGNIIARCEHILNIEKPDIVLVQGDTNSALGGSIASSKLGISIGHVEAGCRSFDKLMSEEINRVLISDIASLNFAPTKNCMDNLLREGIERSRISITGHPIVDLIGQVESKIPDKPKIPGNVYALVTIHRRENILSKSRIRSIMRALNFVSKKIPLIFPCHPHTKSKILEYKLSNYLKDVRLIRPIGYLESLSLVKNAKLVMTDSGGIQQEAAILHVPCITLRDETEWVETCQSGVNFLAGSETRRIIETVQYLDTNYDDIMKNFKRSSNIFGKPGVAGRILRQIEKSV